MRTANTGHQATFTSIITAAFAVLAAGCTAPEPKVTYMDVSKALYPAPLPPGGIAGSAKPPPQVAPLADGEILYALRTTDVTLYPPGSKAGDTSAPPSPTDGCLAPQSMLTAEKAKWPAKVTADPRLCFNGVTATATPAGFRQNVYVVSPSKPFLVKIQLSSSPSAADPLITSTVTVTYTDNRKQYLTDIGTAAAAGYAFGPEGALIAGLGTAALEPFALEGKLAIAPIPGAPQAPPPPAITPLYLNLICERDMQYWDPTKAPLPAKGAPKLTLPVTLSLTDDRTSLADTNPVMAADNTANCWHPVPQAGGEWNNAPAAGAGVSSRAAVRRSLTTGWLYRYVKMGRAPSQMGTVKTTKFFAELANQTSDTKTGDEANFAVTTDLPQLPTTPCETAGVELIWYADAEGQLTKGLKPSPTVADVQGFALQAATSQPMQIANPYYVQPVSLPRGGAVNFGSVCGATVSYTDTFSTFNQIMSNALSQVASTKQAQLTYEKNK